MEQDTLGGRGLARIDVSNDPNISVTFKWMRARH
jgi:hypothetical protein